MLQQVMTEPGKIIFREIPVPEIGDGQVLVKIMDIGVCGSDIHVYHGKHPFTKYPVTQGHEVSGEIVKCGANVEGLTVGQKVTIEPHPVPVLNNTHPFPSKCSVDALCRVRESVRFASERSRVRIPPGPPSKKP